MITPRNISHHELTGLNVTVLRSCCKSYVGISGKVVDETRNMLYIGNSKVRGIPKDASLFQFILPRREIVAVEGKFLVARPEDRLKKRIRRW